MEVKLIQHEIEKAVRLYLVHEEGMKLEGRKLEIEFTAGRNPPSVSCDIKIVRDASDTPDTVMVKEEIVDELIKESTEDSEKPFSDDQSKLPFQEFLS
jgi:hypothetical protein